MIYPFNVQVKSSASYAYIEVGDDLHMNGLDSPLLLHSIEDVDELIRLLQDAKAELIRVIKNRQTLANELGRGR